MRTGIDSTVATNVQTSTTAFEEQAQAVRESISDRGGSPLDRFSGYPADLWPTVGWLTVTGDTAPAEVLANAPLLKVMVNAVKFTSSFSCRLDQSKKNGKDNTHAILCDTHDTGWYRDTETGISHNVSECRTTMGPSGTKFLESKFLREGLFEGNVNLRELEVAATVVKNVVLTSGIQQRNESYFCPGVSAEDWYATTNDLYEGGQLFVLFSTSVPDGVSKCSGNTYAFTGGNLEYALFTAPGYNYVVSYATTTDDNNYVTGREWVIKKTTPDSPPTTEEIKGSIPTDGLTYLTEWLQENGYTGTYSFSIPEACFRNSRLEKFSSQFPLAGIGADAFDGCLHLRSLDVAANASAGIGDRAFRNCYLLERVPFAAASIGESAFENCLSLKSVDIPAGCEVKSRAFAGCIGLTDVRVDPSAKVADDAFSGAGFSSITSLSILDFIQEDENSNDVVLESDGN